MKDASGATITISSGNTESKKWYSYGGNDWSNTFAVVSGTYVAITNGAQNFISEENYVKVLEPTAFTGLSISSLKVVVKLTSADEWWASASSAGSWASETYQTLAWSDDDSGYSAVITSSDFINALATNGLYLEVKAGAVGTVDVQYIAK